MVVMVIPWCGIRSQGVRANVQPKSSISIGAKVEISSEGFILGVKAETEKKLFYLPEVLTKC
jgi:hypothetical protein